MKVMGITFVLMGIVFFVVGLFMLYMMGILSSASAAMGALGGMVPELGMAISLGWIFLIVTFAAGVFSIITAILLFVVKE